MQNVLMEMDQLESTTNYHMIKKVVHTRWLNHENTLLTVRKLYVPIVRDLENAVTEGRDKRIKDGSGIQAGSLLKMMKSYTVESRKFEVLGTRCFISKYGKFESKGGR